VAGAGDEAGLPPVTFFRPLKSGVPDLAAKLGALVRSARPGDQVLIGVEAGSPEAAVAETVRLENPGIEIAVVPGRPGGASNPKVAKLLSMEPQARHEHWILSDSEATIDAGFLVAFRREWTRCDVLTAGYRFRGMAAWPPLPVIIAPTLSAEANMAPGRQAITPPGTFGKMCSAKAASGSGPSRSSSSRAPIAAGASSWPRAPRASAPAPAPSSP